MTAPYTMFTPTPASERLREALTPRTPEQIAEEERRRRLAREAMEGLLTQRPDMTSAPTLRPMTIGPAVARATPEYTMGDIAGEMAMQPFSAAANMVTRVGEGAARTVGAERVANSLRDRRQRINEATAPVTGAGIATRVATDIGASALPYVASGAGALGLLRSAGLTALESRSDDGSLVKGMADLTGSDALQRLAASPYRTATDVGVDMAFNLIPGARQTARTLMQGVPEATQGLTGTQRVARTLQQVMGNAARETATAVRQNPRTALATAAAVAGDVVAPGVGTALAAAMPALPRAAVAVRPARTIAELAAAVPTLVKDSKIAKMAKSLKVDAPAVVGRIARSAKQMYPALARVPKATEESATRKAIGNAVRQIQYDDIDRPTAISNYGELEPATFEDSPVARFTNTPEAMRANADRAMEFLRTADREPWTPREFAFPRGPIQDALYGWPGQQQTAFPRWETQDPQIRSMMEEIYTDPVNRDLIKRQIERGLPFGGETFYSSLYPVFQVAQEAGISPDQVRHWIEATAPASARNSIINENAVGNFLMNLRNRGMELDEATVRREMDNFQRRFGVGLPLMPVHRQGVSNVLEGGGLRDILTRPVRIASEAPEYKIPTYGVQKTGDFAKSWVGDVHEATGETIGSRFHPFFANQGGFDPNQYGLAERFMQGIADEMGLPLGTAQAGRWFGGGELTGLVSPRGDALDILEKQVAYTLHGLGQEVTPRSVRDYTLNLIREGGILLPWFSGKTPMPDMRFNVR